MISKCSNITTVTKLHRLSQQNKDHHVTFFLAHNPVFRLEWGGLHALVAVDRVVLLPQKFVLFPGSRM